MCTYRLLHQIFLLFFVWMTYTQTPIVWCRNQVSFLLEISYFFRGISFFLCFGVCFCGAHSLQHLCIHIKRMSIALFGIFFVFCLCLPTWSVSKIDVHNKNDWDLFYYFPFGLFSFGDVKCNKCLPTCTSTLPAKWRTSTEIGSG